jgi:hypothetical protein
MDTEQASSVSVSEVRSQRPDGAARVRTEIPAGERDLLRTFLADRSAECLTGLVALAAGVGFSCLLLIYFVVSVIGMRRGSPPGVFFVTTLGGLVIEGWLLWAWVGFGRRIRAMTLSQRSTLVVFCFVVTLLNLLVFTAFIR